MQPRIFLNYRWLDHDIATGRIYDRLIRDFPKDCIFYDHESVDYGDNIPNRIAAGLANCNILLVIIGNNWLRLLKERMEDSEKNDWVRIEIAMALKSPAIRVVPVLLPRTEKPPADELPDDLKELYQKEAFSIPESKTWDTSMETLIERIHKWALSSNPFIALMQAKQQDTLVPSMLLNEDFIPQKKHLRSLERKHNFVLLQGTKECRLDYFLSCKHEGNSLFMPVEAKYINIKDGEIKFWEQFAKSLSLSVNFDKYIDKIHFEIEMRIRDKLMEKSIVMIVDDIGFWKDDNYSVTFANYLAKLDLCPNVEHGFYCYFVSTDGTTISDCGENLIVLPPISEMEETDVMGIYEKYSQRFNHNDKKVEQLFSRSMKLSEVIAIFIEHSTCGQTIAHYLERRLIF